MRQMITFGTLLACSITFGVTLHASVIYNNLTPNDLIAVASRPDSPGIFEIEAADDFMRAGTDIVGGAPAPTFNLAFSLAGAVVPEPTPGQLVLSGLALTVLGLIRRTR
ncbi:MAG: hypothetical protein ABI759_10350 [Candidatus Solibacter sp.]